ncbi:cell division protein FtsQ [Bifidobacterium aemilianum]|uniref:Cell division protein FtsQ n=1 Tax=Bifidobacterium aemilianum TaxID=2493120 RepID=A0A366KB04_9BIFI|nr:FtsQ-type POTRA domain-containing protein [Bifidobacterium aemilianum]RBP98547.1 cell division protein FtsQ [Bifidobacterium aemilianum]
MAGRITRSSRGAGQEGNDSRKDGQPSGRRIVGGQAAGRQRTAARKIDAVVGEKPKDSTGAGAGKSSLKNLLCRHRSTKAQGCKTGCSASRQSGKRQDRPAQAAASGPQRQGRVVAASSSGDFVDARQLRSEDLIGRTLEETAGPLGVTARPKVVDFNARRREKQKVNVRAVAVKVLVGLVAAALLSGLVWLLFFSTVFRLESSAISVSGDNGWVSKERILSIADQQAGKSLFLVSSQDVSKELVEIPGVTKAQIDKKFPRSLSVTVQSQKPAAMLKTEDGSMTAVDIKGRTLNSVGAGSPEGIPVIEVPKLKPALDSRAVKEAVKIIGSLPETMRQRISKVTAETQDSITTELDSGSLTVIWGDSSDLKLKQAVTDKIINDPSKIGDKQQVDVSAPLRPIIK